jgi:CRP/FNR family transcriptional regulator, cyclic AMP receptor protein
MSVDTTVALLQRIPILARLRPAQITEIARIAEQAKFRSGDCITEAGASGEVAYLLVSGDAERAAAPGQLLPPGSLIGELAMLVDHAYGATIVAKGRVHCLKITRSAMHGLMLSDPSLADVLSQHITERLRKAANGLLRIDSLLAKGDAASTRQARLMTSHLAHLAESPMDRIQRVQ